MNSLASKTKSNGLVTINNLNSIELYEVRMALIHRHNEAYQRIHSDGKCYGDGTFERHCDEQSVEVCNEIIKMIEADR